MKKIRLISLFLMVSIFLPACAKQTLEPVTVTIEMSEYAFSPDTIEAEVGQQVTLNFVNVGMLEHEIMFGREVRMVNNLPNGYQSDMFETAHVEPHVMIEEDTSDMGESGHGADHSGFMVVLPETGNKATLTFTVTEEMLGEWEIGCFSQEGVHYVAGMNGKFVVNP